MLSERGTVLKENQSLSDKNEAIRKEMDKILKSRDDFAKECEALRQKLEMMRSRSEFLHSNDELYSSKEKMTFLSLEVANQEIDKLKKLLEKVNSEVSIAKGRRDWAIHEREKIVQERDSVRNLCDELRKERDTATSKLLAAIRDKDEAFKKIEQLNEKIEILSNLKKMTDSHDLHNKKQRNNDIEEEVEIDVNHNMMINPNIGINFDFSNETSDYNGNSFYPRVLYVEPNSVFYGKIQPNDCIQYVNGIDCSTLSQRMLIKHIRTSSPTCKMIIKRTKSILKGIYNVQLQLNNGNHGILFENGIFIANIENNSTAYYEPLLSVGDRVLQINEKSVEGIKNFNEFNQIMMNIKNNEKLSLKILKSGQFNDGLTTSSFSKGWSRMTNQSTQTDHGDLKRSIEMTSFLPIVPFIPPPPLVQEPDNSIVNTSISSSSPNSSKSSSKFTPKNMFQKIRDAISNTNKENQENDAIAVLDSVLDSQDSLDVAQEKSKKSKYKKNIAKSWPRAAMALHDSGKSHSGTVVFNKKKERPRLYLISTDDQPNKDDRKDSVNEKMSAEQQKAVDTLFQPPKPPSTTPHNHESNIVTKSHLFTRNNVIPPRSTMVGAKSPIYMHTIYEPTTSSNSNKNFHNRLSLNLSNTPPKPHFFPNTFVPIKTSSSIESTQISKSPLNHPTIKDDSMDYTSQKLNRYLNNYAANKYDNISDGENLSSSGGVSQQDSLNNASIGTLPSHLRAPSVGRVQGSPGEKFVNQNLELLL